MLQFTRDDIMRVIELGVMAILALIVLLIGVRPLVRKAIAPERGGQAAIAASTAAGAGGTAASLLGGAGGTVSLGAPGSPNVSFVGGEDVSISNHTSAMIDIAKVQGQVHAESVKKVGELADRNPTEAVSIVRSWLHEQAA